ncbi:glycosytransferase [Bradyrhizobium diazoefficiens]|nr:glycosytransferase [Bradyrhizobium diazoefficiens]MBR0850300.1 glycosytransferase [Bradyrhizobium diazoefficiens]
MSEVKNCRVMWLLNHGAARKFEVPMLKSLGIREIFLPKIIPPDYNFRSALIDFSEDASLTIPGEHLAILNATDWYGDVPAEVWNLANQYFDFAFFIVHRLEAFNSITRGFKGAAIWRAYGLDSSMSYSKILDLTRNAGGWRNLRSMGNRFWFGHAYSHLHLIENPPLKDRSVFLPLGLNDQLTNTPAWTGQRRQVFFVCPELGFNPYYKKVYEEFRTAFSGFDFVVGGPQPIAVRDERVLGYVPAEQYASNMQELRVMFYHSTEPNHVHFHPFEAVRAGMPLVFMAGGLLDRLGGAELPGRCTTIEEARKKIKRILDDDWELIDQIRSTQSRLLEAMRPEACRPIWERNFTKIQDELECSRQQETTPVATKRKKIAIFLPIAYRGGTLRAAKLLATTLLNGSRSAGEKVDIVFAHVDDPESYRASDFDDLPAAITRRALSWTVLDEASARRAMAYAGFERWQPSFEAYSIPDDGGNHFLDCDLWLFVSDRLSVPLLPVRPYMLMVYDYVHRYLPAAGEFPHGFLAAARLAERVIVTTRFTESDALQYAGVAPKKLLRLPHLIPELEPTAQNAEPAEEPYFVWPTNAAAHKNHKNAFSALRIYWEEMAGSLDCHITGVNSGHLLDDGQPYPLCLGSSPDAIDAIRERIQLRGELSEPLYAREVRNAQFVWHPARIDNGTFSVIEAAHLGVPSLSSDYPAMREIDDQFGLNLAWMPGDDPWRMASALKLMESSIGERRALLPTRERMRAQDLPALSQAYWKAIRECL